MMMQPKTMKVVMPAFGDAPVVVALDPFLVMLERHNAVYNSSSLGDPG